MTLSTGTRLGPYEILGPLGAGGMGEVYRARDTRLGRVVALKILPDAFARDPERRGRFEREARAIASLSHPHICALHDVGHEREIDFLVMELLEGQSLAARLASGPPDLDVALVWAVQITEALAAAHRQGIVHRDLKPGNVMLTRRGAMLLDFGLARLRTDPGQPIGSEAETAPVTREGQLIGTLGYMAPEQLEGKPADLRTDVFALGTLLFEMLTGTRAFVGDNQATLIGAILHGKVPSASSRRPDVPPGLDRLLDVCLAKDREERWSSAQDVLHQLRYITSSPVEGLSSEDGAPKSRERLAWGLAALASIATVILGGVLIGNRSSSVEPTAAPDRLSILPPPSTTIAPGEAPQISPDGRHVAFVAIERSGRRSLFVRNRDSLTARPLPDTDNASLPFWAPDSQRLGFFAGGHLETISLDASSASTLTAAPVPRGGTWNQFDEILFLRFPNQPVHLIKVSGGSSSAVSMGQDEATCWFPTFLPDGRHYLCLAVDPFRARPKEIRVASLDSTETSTLVVTDFSAAFDPEGYVLYRRGADVVSQPFDTEALRFTGDPVPVASDVAFNAVSYQALFSVSSQGTIAYRPQVTDSQLVWFDRAGRRLDAVTPSGSHNTLCLTSDDRTVVYESSDPTSASVDLWAVDASGGAPTRLTFDPEVDFYPICSPSEPEVIFASLKDGAPNLFRLKLNSPGKDEELLRSPAPTIPTDWSADGTIVFSAFSPVTSFDIATFSVGEAPTTFAGTPAEERNGRLSPDGRWLAYVSNESGRFEVVVQPFPPTGPRWQVSSGGGLQPRWRRDGRELYYLGPDDMLMAVELASSGSDLQVRGTSALFQTRLAGWEPNVQGNQYDVSADGQRFLVSTASESAHPIHLVLDWRAQLR